MLRKITELPQLGPLAKPLILSLYQDGKTCRAECTELGAVETGDTFDDAQTKLLTTIEHEHGRWLLADSDLLESGDIAVRQKYLGLLVPSIIPPKPQTEFTVFYPSGHYNQATVMAIIPDEARHSFWNHRQIWLDFQDDVQEERDWRGRRGYDLKDLENTRKGPALILGSGPGLDEALPLLKDWKGGLVCSSSHCNTLARYGVRPTHIVYSDVRCRWEEIDGVPEGWWEEAKDTCQIVNPGTHPGLIAKWPQKTYYYIPRDPAIPLYWQIWPAVFMHAPPFIKMALLPFACSPAAELGIARAIGYNPVFMIGHNFGFIPEMEGKPARYRFRGWRYGMDGKQEWQMEPAAGVPSPESIVMSENGYPSTAMNLFYKRSMFFVARLECHREEPLQLICATPHSTISPAEFPYMAIEDVIAGGGAIQDSMKRTNEEQMWNCERYLARVGSYCVRFQGEKAGVRFCDIQRPESWREFLTGYMMKVNRDIGRNTIDIAANLGWFEKLHQDIGDEKEESPGQERESLLFPLTKEPGE